MYAINDIRGFWQTVYMEVRNKRNFHGKSVACLLLNLTSILSPEESRVRVREYSSVMNPNALPHDGYSSEGASEQRERGNLVFNKSL